MTILVHRTIRIVQHPKLHVKSSLNAGAFSKTKGFVVKCTSKAVSKFLQHPVYGDCFGSLFERIRLPDTHAYVSNALLYEPLPLTEMEQSQRGYAQVRDSTAVGIHLDETVAMKGTNPHDFLAHQLNVMYVDVPEDMVGGSLELWKCDDSWRYVVSIRTSQRACDSSQEYHGGLLSRQ